MTDTASDDRLIRFLLGQIDEEERQGIERECLRIDGEAFAALLALEDELRVLYAQGGLAPGDRPAFEALYMATISDRSRMTFARALAQIAARGGRA